MILTLHGSSNTINSLGAFDFTNHIKSSLDIEPNSSIALVNATVERLSELIIGGVSGSNGTVQMSIDNPSPDAMKNIHIPSGVYNTDTLASTLESVMNSNFNQHGYTFYVAYDKKEDKFSINWHQGSVKGTIGKPKFPNLQTDLTQSISGTGTKLAIADGTTAGQWYMARGDQKLPDYKVFDEPSNATSGIYIMARLNIPNDGEMIMGVTGVEAYPSPNNHYEGCFGYKIKEGGHIEISEGRLGETDLNYIAGNNWTASDGVPDVWVLHQYHGNHGYDYICIPNNDPTQTVYVKKIGDGKTLHKSATDTADFNQKGVLSANNQVITWSDLDGSNVSTWTSTTGAKLSNQNSKVVYSKPNPLVHQNNGINNNGGGKICASWGSTGYVKYWFRNQTDSHWSQVHISSPDRVPVEEMFGSGLGLMEYAGIRTPVTWNATTNYIFQMRSILSASLDFSDVDFSDVNVYKLNEVAYTPTSPSNPTNKIVMGTTNPSQVIMRNTEAMFLDVNAIPKGTFGTFSWIVSSDSQDHTWTVGLMGDNLISGITPNGSNRDLANMSIGIQNYDTGGGVFGIKGWFNNAQFGYSRNYAQMGDNPKLTIQVSHTGGVDLYYSTKANNYADILPIHNSVVNVSVQNNLLPMIRSTNISSSEFTDLKIETEKLTQHTGLVHFNAFQMSDVLGMTGSTQASDDGSIGFVSSNKPDVEPEECDNPTIHLQLKNLPIVSLNGHTSRTEKTLAVIPRYTSDEHSAKGLESVNFYEPNNLIYKSFNNPRKMALNSVQVQLTNNDGSLAKDVSCFDCTLDIRPTGY